MRNTFLIIKREYLQRVRTKAFIIFTVLMPVFMGVVILGPARLITMNSGGSRNLVVVASNQETADLVKNQLQSVEASEVKRGGQFDEDQNPAPKYSVETTVGGGDELRKQLTAQVSDGKLDGYIWLTDQEIANQKFFYATKHSSDFFDASTVRGAVNNAVMRLRLIAQGIKPDQVDGIIKNHLSMDTVGIQKGGAQSKAGGMAGIMLPFMLMFMIYITLIIYGVAVMRSVLEEKTSRVMEVMLSSANATQMMAGKILGVGAVGLTQVLIWIVSGFILSSGMVAAMRPYLKDVQLPLMVYICFPVFFLLGYLLYSTMYAAVGAMVNSDEEAQQMQWPVLLPLILCTVFAMSVIRDPSSPLAFWASMFPLTAPIIMFVRVAVQPQLPGWQLALSISLLILTTWGMVWLCSRIYRVGILMYGKRPTIPEIMKWIKYA
jgi:ABC-2 type transport system permease protein